MMMIPSVHELLLIFKKRFTASCPFLVKNICNSDSFQETLADTKNKILKEYFCHDTNRS